MTKETLLFLYPNLKELVEKNKFRRRIKKSRNEKKYSMGAIHDQTLNIPILNFENTTIQISTVKTRRQA